MIEEMEIGILLSIAGDAPKALSGLADQMGSLDALVKTLTDSFAGLNEVMASTAGAAADAMGSLDGLVASNRLVNRTLGRTVVRTSEAARGYAAMADSIKGVTDAQAAMGAASGMGMIGGAAGRGTPKESAGGPEKWHSKISNHLQSAGGFVWPLIGLDMGGHIFKDFLAPSLAYGQEKWNLKSRGMPNAQYQAMIASANHTANILPLTTYADAVKTMSDNYMIFGSAKAAIQNETASQRMIALMTPAMGRHNAETQAFSGAKAIELQNKWQDPAQYARNVKRMENVWTATGHIVDPTDMMMAIKYLHGWQLTLSNNFLYKTMPALIAEVKNKGGGASTAGTGLNALRASLFSGQAPRRYVPWMIQMGLEKASDVNMVHKEIYGFKPGTLTHYQMFLHHPGEWFRKVLKPIETKMGLHGAVGGMKMASMITNNAVAQQWIEMFLEQQAKLAKFHGQYGQAAATNKGSLHRMIKDDPRAVFGYADSSFDNMLTMLGTQVLPQFTKQIEITTSGIKWLIEEFKKYPGLAKGVFDTIELIAVGAVGSLMASLGLFLLRPFMAAAPYIGRLVFGFADLVPYIGDAAIALMPLAPEILLVTGAFAGVAAAGWELGKGLHALAHDLGWASGAASAAGLQVDPFHTAAGKRAWHQAQSSVHAAIPFVHAPSHLDRSDRQQIDAVHAALPFVQVHTHINLDGQHVADVVTQHQMNAGAPSGVSQYSPFSTMPYPQNPAPTGG
jgi:hypothetical protein